LYLWAPLKNSTMSFIATSMWLGLQFI